MRAPTCLSIVLSSALALAPLSAQFVPTAVAGGMTVVAGAQFAPAPTPGSDVWPGFVRDASGAAASAHLGVGHEQGPGALTITWSLTAAKGGGSGSATSDGDVLYECWSSLPIVGTVTISWGALTNGIASAGCSIDLGADGVVDATGVAALPVALAPGEPLRLRVRATATASAGTQHGPFGSSWTWSGSAQAGLQLRFEPPPANVTTLQPACGAAWLGAAANLLDGVDFTGSLAAANELAVLGLGLAALPAPAPLPWSSCSLAIDPVVLLVAPVVPGQNQCWSITVPRGLRPATVCGQLLGLDLDAPALTASAALAATLP